jgi:hypothetical protein
MPDGGTATSYTIQEVSSQTGAAGLHSVILAGRALPYRPYEVSGEMRATVTWYPGSPVATLQMLGSKEDESTINGMWKDVFISPVTDSGVTVFGGTGSVPVQPEGVALIDGVQAADVATLAKFIDTIRRRGQLLQVSWDTESRYGYMKKFRKKWHRHEDLEWEITFEWISIEQAPPPVGFHTQGDQAGLLANLQTKLSKLLAKIQPPFDALFTVFDTVVTATSDIQDAVNSIQNAIANMTIAVLAPVDSLRIGIAACQSVIDNSNVIIDSLQSVPSLGLINEPLPSLGEGDALASAKYSRSVIRAAQDMKATAADQADQFRVQAEQQDIIAIFTASDNTDLRRISVTYYGTPDNWQQIMQFNGLSTSLLFAGQLVLVPRLTTGDA